MCMLIYSLCPSCCALQLQRQRISDRFKNREDAFFDRLEDDLFPDLYSMRDYAQKTHIFWQLSGALEQPRWSFGELIQISLKRLSTMWPLNLIQEL